jgi:hypothetical protein
LADIRSAISGLIAKLENDPHFNWHSCLDSYALISGQVSIVLDSMLTITAFSVCVLKASLDQNLS